MDNFIKKIPPFDKEELECLEKLSKMTDEDIDFSDIPKITHEEFVRAIERKRQKQKLKTAS